MKSLIIVLCLFVQGSLFAVTCEGEGYSVSIDSSAATLSGPGIESVSDQVRDQGSYFTANFKEGSVRSLTVAPFSQRMTLITTGGVKVIKVACEF